MSQAKTFQIPSAARVQFVDSDGKTMFEEEVIYLDDLLSQAQEGIDVESDEKAVSKWLPIFKQLLKDNFECELGDTEAYFVARESSNMMWDLKKKFDDTQTLSTSTESTPSS